MILAYSAKALRTDLERIKPNAAILSGIFDKRNLWQFKAHLVQTYPKAFKDGLNHWSIGDGTPGSQTYDAVDSAAFVPSDGQFDGCLELQKIHATQKLRYTTRTPVQKETYSRWNAIEMRTGNLPAARIAAYAIRSNGSHVSEVTQFGSSTA